MCIENESTGNYTCSHAPYTRFTSVQGQNKKKLLMSSRYCSAMFNILCLFVIVIGQYVKYVVCSIWIIALRQLQLYYEIYVSQHFEMRNIFLSNTDYNISKMIIITLNF